MQMQCGGVAQWRRQGGGVGVGVVEDFGLEQQAPKSARLMTFVCKPAAEWV